MAYLLLKFCKSFCYTSCIFYSINCYYYTFKYTRWNICKFNTLLADSWKSENGPRQAVYYFSCDSY